MEGNSGSSFQNRRKHPRFKVPPSLFCLFSLVQINGGAINASKPAQGEIVNISEGGLRFATNLMIPVNKDIEAKVVFKLGKSIFERRVRLLHQQEGLPPTYGACFTDKLNIGEEIRFNRALNIQKNEHGWKILPD